VPFITGASSAQIGGPDDYLGVENRGDVLVVTSEPLSEPLELIGLVRLIAYVATSKGVQARNRLWHTSSRPSRLVVTTAC
jgi:predicted acyl esterase